MNHPPNNNESHDILTPWFMSDLLNGAPEDHESCDHKKRIPEILNQKTRSDPRNVSIGPNHYGKSQLSLMQPDKLRGLRHFVKRGHLPIDFYIQALMTLVTPIRKHYEQLGEYWQDDTRFVILMLVDGVFLLEFLSVTRGNRRYSDYDTTDPIFGYKGHMLIYPVIMQDLLMLKNQLPYLVLSTLLSVSEGLPEKNIQSILSWMMFAPRIEPGLHLLDMYLKGLLAGGQRAEEEEEENRQLKRDYKHEQISFSFLYYKCGVRYARVKSFSMISFDSDTETLGLPSLHINKQSVLEFVNLISYELQERRDMYLNSYFHLLGSLIQSPNDVSILRSHGIIVNSSSSDETVMELIKEIANEAVQGDMTCSTNLVLNELNEYYYTNKSWRRSGNLYLILRRRSHKLLLDFLSQRQHLKHMPSIVRMR